MLLVQKYLQTQNLERLKSRGINATPHPKYPNLIHLCYDQIDVKSDDFLARECRGLILDRDNDWAIVSHPMHRFFNQGEFHAAEIDWWTARVYDKLDGSLTILWHYKDKWHVSTKGSPAASGKIGTHDITFEELFWDAFSNKGWETGDLDTSLTYMFELTSPFNRIVVSYEYIDLRLLAVRHVRTGHEMALKMFSYLNPVKSYPMTTLNETIEAANKLYPLTHEGYVVVDANFNRVKIKSPKYVALHHLKNGFGPRRIIDLLKLGEKNEVLLYFPEYVDQFNELEAQFNAFVALHESAYTMVKHIEDQKEFALKATKFPASGALFRVRKGQSPNVRAAINEIPSDKIEVYLKEMKIHA